MPLETGVRRTSNPPLYRERAAMAVQNFERQSLMGYHVLLYKLYAC